MHTRHGSVPMPRSRLGRAALLGAIAALAALFCVASAAEARNIKVGIIDCYSGPPAVYARDALNGFKLAPGVHQRGRRAGGGNRVHHPGHQGSRSIWP